MRFKEIAKNLAKLNIKTLYFNFKYLPYSQAIRLPIWVSRKCYLKEMKGTIEILGIVTPGMIQLGYGDVGIFDKNKSRSIWQVAGRVVFQGKTRILHGCKINVGQVGTLQFGVNVYINAETSIVCKKSIIFGDNCLLSWQILIMDSDLHIIKNRNGEVINEPAAVCIGASVWIGCQCLILKGVTIGEGNIIAASSTISRSVNGTRSVLGGNPIRILREDVSWEL